MQKSLAQEDIRVQRTRRLILQALFQLTVEKGFTAVTVSDIVKRAQINRSTFYRHCLDKHDLLNKYLDELQAQISEAAFQAEKVGKAAPENVPAGLLLLIKHVEENAEFYRVMLGERGDQVFTHRFHSLSEQRYRYVFSQLIEANDQKSYPIELKLSYISFATVGVIRWWLENNRPIMAEQLAIWLRQLSMTVAELDLQPSNPYAL